MSRRALAILVGIVACARVARADVDHAAHHPGSNAATVRPARPEVIVTGSPAPDDPRGRSQIAIAKLAHALETALAAVDRDDARGQAAALADARAGLDELEQALSIRAGLAAPPPDGNAPLRWFRSETGAPAAESPARISAVHVVSMAALVALVVTGGLTALRRRRRARAILAAAIPAATAVPPPRPSTWSGQLRIAAIFIETPSIRTFRLVATDGPAIPFAFRAGQYVRATADLGDGAMATRAYSISSSPGQQTYIELTIKREPNGKVSRYFHDRAKVGDTVAIAGPAGQFTFAESRDRLLLIGGGVGLTPLASVLRDLTERGWPGQILLIASIASAEERLFGAELDLLAGRHANLTVHTVVAAPSEPATWIDRAYLERTVPEPFRWRAHVCGPPTMMTAMTGYLRELGVPADQIWTEAFTATRSAPHEGEGTAHEVRFAVSDRTGVARGKATILDVADLAGVHIDASCRVGVCGACKVGLTKGRCTMAVDEALTDVDRANGVVLACQAVPDTNVEVKA